MHRKKSNVIYTILILTLICVCIYFVYIKKDDNTDNEERLTLSEDEISQLDDKQLSEYEKLLTEIEIYREQCRKISIDSKDYREGMYGTTHNKEFVKEECLFRSVIDMVEYEFIDYEVIDNISQYIEQAKEDIESGKTTEIHYLFDRYISSGHLGEDGTLLPQNRVVYKINRDNGQLGEKIIEEESKVVAIKLKVRYKNLSVKENEVWYDKLHRLVSYVYADDNNLYSISSVYRRNWIFETLPPVYTTMAERCVLTNSSLTGVGINYTCIKLEPLEECIGELIYIVPEAELDNIAFISNYAVNGDTSNYKDIGTNIVFASYLKEKFTK